MDKKPVVNRLSPKTESDINQVFEEYLVKRKNQLVYHYTTLESLMSIVEKNELWITNAIYQNDRYESYDYIDKTLLAIENINLKKKKEYITGIEEYFKAENLDKEKFNPFDIDKSELAFEKASYFVFSACKQRNYIPMWNYYSQSCGVCIEFKESQLHNFFKEALTECKKDKISFEYYNCIYDSNTKENLIKKCIDLSKNEMNGEEYLFVSKYWNSMYAYAYMFKDEGFSYEKEKRFIFSVDPNLIYENHADVKAGKTLFPINIDKDFVCMSNTIKPILKIRAPKMKVPINNIYLSPLNSNETSIRGIKRLMDYYGYDINPTRELSGLR